MSGSVVRADDVPALAERLAPVRARGGRVAFVPTMGALHAGHRSLVEVAADHAGADGAVVVSVFVNPTQFDDPADLAAYPRDLDADVADLAELAARLGRDLIVHAPTVTSLYPDHPAPMATRVTVRGLTEHLCGPHRPGHFDAVATVVVKLLGRVRPDLVVLGRKDAQQLAVVRRVVADLELRVEVIGAPTVRDQDGLALSSRNARLDAAMRALARRLPLALAVGVRTARTEGAALAADVIAAVRAVLDAGPADDAALAVEYVELVDAEALRPITGALGGRALLAAAVHVGEGTARVRLIDNVTLGDADDEDRLRAALAGVPLADASPPPDPRTA